MPFEKFPMTPCKHLARPYRVAITIATYRRPALLQALLATLSQEIEDLYKRPENQLAIKVLVAENNLPEKDGARVTAAMSKDYPCELVCLLEHRKGVSIVRNTLTAAALKWTADFILFIDDDEQPSRHWIENMVDTADNYKAAIVSGPLIPTYEATPPRWVVNGGFFEDNTYATGTFPPIKRIGNTLIRASWLSNPAICQQNSWFNESLGRYGGEDSMLIESLLSQGARHVWCKDAVVAELVPESRQTFSYLAGRAYRFGNIGLLYRSKLKPDSISMLIRFGKTGYLLVRWVALSGRYLRGKERRNQHFFEFQTLLGRINAHRGIFRQHY